MDVHQDGLHERIILLREARLAVIDYEVVTAFRDGVEDASLILKSSSVKPENPVTTVALSFSVSGVAFPNCPKFGIVFSS